MFSPAIHELFPRFDKIDAMIESCKCGEGRGREDGVDQGRTEDVVRKSRRFGEQRYGGWLRLGRGERRQEGQVG